MLTISLASLENLEEGTHARVYMYVDGDIAYKTRLYSEDMPNPELDLHIEL